MKNNILCIINKFIIDYYESGHNFNNKEFLDLLNEIIKKMNGLDNQRITEINSHLMEISAAFEKKDYYYVIDYLENVFMKSSIIEFLGDEGIVK